MLSLLKLSTTEAKKILQVLLEPDEKRPQVIVPCLHGRPGTAKSALGKSLANVMKAKFTDLRGAYMEPTDLTGLPYIHAGTGKTHYAQFNMLPSKDSKEPVLVLIDELNRSREDTMNAFFQLLLDRSVGQTELPNNCSMMVAVNLGEEDGTNVREMDPALWTRMFHILVEPDVNEWTEYIKGEQKELAPLKKIGKPHAGVKEMVTSFCATNQKFFQQDPVAAPYGNLRTWDKVIQTLERWSEYYPLTAQDVYNLSAGLVGISPAIALRSYFENHKATISAKEIMEEYEKVEGKLKKMAKDPNQKDLMYGLVGEVDKYIEQLGEKHEKHHAENVFKFMKDILTQDHAVALYKAIVDKEKSPNGLKSIFLNPKNNMAKGLASGLLKMTDEEMKDDEEKSK